MTVAVPMSGTTVRLSQRMSWFQKDRLRREAKRKNLDETSILNIALNEYFERHGEPEPDDVTREGEQIIEQAANPPPAAPKKRGRKCSK